MNDQWIQIFTVIGSHFFMLLSVFGIIWWFRRESREDWVRCQNTLDAIKDEMKDFHERLLKIEMDRKN